MTSFTESGMLFSFSDDTIFLIEKSPTYKSLQTDSKICECVVLDKEITTLYLIEAKTSFPNPNSHYENRFDINVNAIVEKFLNTLTLYIGLLLNRPYTILSKLPSNLSLAAFAEKQFKIAPVLIISDFKQEWLPPVSEALNNTLSSYPYTKFFVIESVLVLNREMAKDKKLIQA